MIASIIVSYDSSSDGLISAQVLHPDKGSRGSGRTFAENAVNKAQKIPVFDLAPEGALKSMTARHSAEDRSRKSAIRRADFSYC
jgi:hypothetical protein